MRDLSATSGHLRTPIILLIGRGRVISFNAVAVRLCGEEGGSLTTIADAYQDRPLTSHNDVIFKSMEASGLSIRRD